MSLSIGKLRGLAQCSTKRKMISILALDHRGNLRRALNPQDPDSVSHEAMVDFKGEVVSSLAPHASAVLLDPEIGTAPGIAGHSIPGNVGLLVALEATGYTGDASARFSQVLPGWGVDKIKRLGASGVKLLVYYHPEASQAAQQESLVEQVAEQCVRYDLPLFLEPLSYSIDSNRKKLPSGEIRQVVIETARRLTPLGIDILKAEFPLDVKEESDERTWLEACQELNSASKVPWTLLSAGVSFDTFLRQVTVACQAGCSGVLAGRAVWQEAADLSSESRTRFLRDVASERMARLTGLCDALGRSWAESYPAGGTFAPDWYQDYSGLE